jgi:hypothetical protein
MLKTGLAALAVAMTAGMTMAETPKAPWDSEILPPALAWHGASEKLIAKPSDPWITPSELTGLTASPDYAETRAWLEKLAAASPLIRMETFGKSPEGRDLLVLYVSKDGKTFDPKKPVLLVQAGIHPGEIDGKDAGMMLLRDMAFHGKDKLAGQGQPGPSCRSFSVDGHERASPYSRPNQRGPAIQGWRHTAQNLNLNRDYGKLDSPEMRARSPDRPRGARPLHGHPRHRRRGLPVRRHLRLGRLPGRLRALQGHQRLAGQDLLLPAMRQGLKAAGHIPGQLVFALDDRDPKTGLGASPASLRYLQRLWRRGADRHGAGRKPFSLKPYRQRVLGTYVLHRGDPEGAGQGRRRPARRRAPGSRPSARPIKANFGTNFGGAASPAHRELPGRAVRDLRLPRLGPARRCAGWASPIPSPGRCRSTPASRRST